MPDEPRRPSDTHPIDRRALLEQMVATGHAVVCPACGGDGAVSPRIAARIRPAMPPIPQERATLPELIVTDEEDTGTVPAAIKDVSK